MQDSDKLNAMTVYVLMEGDCTHHGWVFGIYRTRKLAEARRKVLTKLHTPTKYWVEKVTVIAVAGNEKINQKYIRS